MRSAPFKNGERNSESVSNIDRVITPLIILFGNRSILKQTFGQEFAAQESVLLSFKIIIDISLFKGSYLMNPLAYSLFWSSRG